MKSNSLNETAYIRSNICRFFMEYSMKKVIGYTLFWFALGMLVMLVLSNEFVGILIIAVCLLLSFYISGCK